MFILEIANGYPFQTSPLIGLFELMQAKALAKLGHKVVFIGIDLRSIRRKRKLGFSHFYDENVEVYTYAFPLGRVPAKLFAFFEFFYLKKLYKKINKKHGKPDILHAHFCCFQGYIAAKLKNKFYIPLVITEHSSECITGIDTNRKKYFSYGYEQADAIISVGSLLKDHVFSSFNRDSCVIPNIVNNVFFNTKPITKNIQFTFVSVAGLISGKGMDILIKAFSKLDMQDIKLLIVGDGTERKKLELMISRYALEDKVFLLGYKTASEIADILKAAHCFVLASRAETFGIVYIEALAMGLPIIATNCGGPTDIVSDDNGYMVEVDDIKGLSEVMKEMVLNYLKFDRKKIADNAYKRYSDVSVAKQIEKVFYNVLNN